MDTNAPLGNKFLMADGSTMTRDEILTLTKRSHTVIAYGVFGKPAVKPLFLIQHAKSLITVNGDTKDAEITVEKLHLAVIRATHIVCKFGSAKISHRPMKG